ncbi:hypothetical protein ANN_26620 [Periplaneta americana]|uniref:Reverse transcriptase domain-containing protein n=1 Tax=Periplaneta americana TaxID=6978 RepID=A0ABQ8RYK0_PERAM|nr:hypothetical protein ANN_26620 [Periplaneta americana]
MGLRDTPVRRDTLIGNLCSRECMLFLNDQYKAMFRDNRHSFVKENSIFKLALIPSEEKNVVLRDHKDNKENTRRTREYKKERGIIFSYSGQIDFSRSFDVVPHDILLVKLQSTGIDFRVLQWIKEFLTCRTQRVRVWEELSNPIEITSGVPQRSVLGPLLCLAFVNDLPVTILSRVRLFADDCMVYGEIKSYEDSTLLQTDLNRINDLAIANRMKINYLKSKAISFTRKRNKIVASYTLGCETIPEVNKCKYLGITFSSDLGWGEHVTDTAGKAWRALHFVMRVLRKGSDKSKEIAYKSLVRPVMEYGAACWDPYRLEHIKTLEKIKKRALKCCRKNSPFKWDTLTDRRTRIRLCALFKTYRGEHAWRETKKNRLQPPNYSSRNDHSYKLRERRQRTDTGKFSFLNRTIRDWNALPVDLLKALPTTKNKQIRQQTHQNWNTRWTTCTTGSLTRDTYFPTIHDRLKSHHFKPTFVTTQFLAGHRKFGTYFDRFNIPADIDSTCSCREGLHNVKHLLFDCPIIEAKRFQIKTHLLDSDTEYRTPLREVSLSSRPGWQVGIALAFYAQGCGFDPGPGRWHLSVDLLACKRTPARQNSGTSGDADITSAVASVLNFPSALSSFVALERIPNLTGEQSDGITVFRIPPMTSMMLHWCRTGAINLQRDDGNLHQPPSVNLIGSCIGRELADE